MPAPPPLSDPAIVKSFIYFHPTHPFLSKITMINCFASLISFVPCTSTRPSLKATNLFSSTENDNKYGLHLNHLHDHAAALCIVQNPFPLYEVV